MTIKARMICTLINTTNQEAFVSVGLVPVASSDPDDPNYSYSQSTPSGQVSLNITNKAAYDAFEVGGIYDITFEKYVAPVPVAPADPPADPESETSIQGTSTGYATPEPVAVEEDPATATPEAVEAPAAPAPESAV